MFSVKSQLGAFTAQCPGGLGPTSYLQEVSSPLLMWAEPLSPSTGSSLVRKKICNGTWSSPPGVQQLPRPGHTLLTRPQKSARLQHSGVAPGTRNNRRGWPRAITIFFVLEGILKHDAIFIACQKHPNCILITLQRKP